MAVNENRKVLIQKLAHSRASDVFGKRPSLVKSSSSDENARKRADSDAKIKKLLADVKARHEKIFGS
jgi:hypothetical protein